MGATVYVVTGNSTAWSPPTASAASTAGACGSGNSQADIVDTTATGGRGSAGGAHRHVHHHHHHYTGGAYGTSPESFVSPEMRNWSLHLNQLLFILGWLAAGLQGNNENPFSGIAPGLTATPMLSPGTGVPGAGNGVPTPDGAAKDDKRSAEEILAGSQVWNKLGRQKDIKQSLDQAKKWTGDWTSAETDPQKRKDAAANLVEVLEYIDQSKAADGRDRGGVSGDGKLDGVTKDGDIRAGTEAAALKDFSKQGYSYFDGSHQLKPTKDGHVRWDGSNKDNFQKFVGDVGETFKFIPGVGNILQGAGESTGGLGGMILGGLDGVLSTFEGGLAGLSSAVQSGTIDPMSLMTSIYNGSVSYNPAS